jgi:cyclopropane fatty-acyl-phospholipid synthase-like methyltransferase
MWGWELQKGRIRVVSDDRVSDIYNLRFRSQANEREIASRENAWKALYTKAIQKFIEPDMTVMDLGSGPGYFANQVRAKKVIAVDLDANNSKYLNGNVDFHNGYSQNLSFQESSTVDLVFSSNLFEHLGSSATERGKPKCPHPPTTVIFIMSHIKGRKS